MNESKDEDKRTKEPMYPVADRTVGAVGIEQVMDDITQENLEERGDENGHSDDLMVRLEMGPSALYISKRKPCNHQSSRAENLDAVVDADPTTQVTAKTSDEYGQRRQNTPSHEHGDGVRVHHLVIV